MPRLSSATRCVASLVFAAWILCSSQLRAADAPKEQELIAVLQHGEPGEKALACKKLAIYGSPAAAPELAKLLADEQLASWARIALEAIPGPEAEQALRDSAKNLSGNLLIGAINSIGVRRDAQATPDLIVRLTDGDVEVARAAAWALGRIGNDDAAEALSKALPKTQNKLRDGVAEGCILCAERMLVAGRADVATKLYDEVRTAEVERPRLLEATRGAILARGEAGIPLLIEQLRANDIGRLQIALSTAREMPGREVAVALAAELKQATPARGAMLLAALADRTDAAVTPEVLAAASEGDPSVRIAAIRLIGRAGEPAHLAPLLAITATDDLEVSQAAKAAIAVLPGEGVDADIASRLASAEGKELLALLTAAAERRVTATETLVKLSEHQDGEVRNGAIAALGESIGPSDLHVLIDKASSEQDGNRALRALRTACLRMPDREACAEQLTVAMPSASQAAKVELLSILGAMGGARALQTISDAVRGSDETLQDAGSRVLGEWMNVDAAPTLQALSRDAASEKLRVRALRGYLRLARQFRMPDDQRAEMCATAISLAGRNEERLLALAILERYPSVPTLRVAIDAAENEALKNEAQRVAIAMAPKLDTKDSDVVALLSKLKLQPVELEIIKAEYGAAGQSKDVTEVLRKHARNLRLIGLPKANYNASFGGDPAPNVVKQLKVSYRINGKANEATFGENEVVLLPMPE
jgi:HEAT repeat protein